ALSSDNLFWRKHAQRMLVERGERDVVPQLVALVKEAKTDAIGLAPGAMHALWTLDGLGVFAESDAAKEATDVALHALEHPSAGVRRAALTVLPRKDEFGPRIAERLTDDDAQVQL